ncbi:MAG: HD-GYP domain-containing protein [Planctomycetota bacterium]|jgi:putative two-component system response regulator
MDSQDRPRILVVDDESNIRDIVERALRKVGYRGVAQADSVGAARRRIAEEGPFALVVLDIRMPDEPGTKLLKELAPLAPATVTIMATAVAEIETAIQALKAGAYDYLVKPLIPDAIQLSAGRALRRRRLELDAIERQERARLLIEDRTQALEATRHALLRSLCQMVEFRDAETGAHLRRIPQYARILAVDLAQNSPYGEAITDDFVAHLVESAPLHDIGKVAVPDSILLKPAELTQSEFEEIKRHTVAGCQLCQSVRNELGEGRSSFIDMATEVTYSHHERWDGEGYPLGSAEADTPLSGRIVHMADFYDACRSPRVYRPEPVPREKVMEMIEEGRGVEFDPEVVDSFLRVRDRFIAVEEGNQE